MKQNYVTAASIICGVVCAACVAAFMANVQGEADAARAEALARYGGEQVEVCVATRDIAAGERVDLSAVELRLWVADLLPDEPIRESSAIVGKTATSSIVKGEVITQKRFESDRDSLEVPEGKAAVSVPAKAVRAVGGAIRPNMSVDVYSTGGSATAVLARDVLVLDTSVGESSSLTSSDSGWITLAVDPGRVEEIVAASNKTDLYFVLPGQRVDEGMVSEEGSSDQAAASGTASQAAASSSAASTSSPEPSGGASTASASAASENASQTSESASHASDEEGDAS